MEEKKSKLKEEKIKNPLQKLVSGKEKNSNGRKMKKETAKKGPNLPTRLVTSLADEIAKLVVARLPKSSPNPIKKEKADINPDAYFLDTSAIIDGRIIDFLKTSFLKAQFVVLTTVLLELKHIADSHEDMRKARGRRGLEMLDQLKKVKEIEIKVLPVEEQILRSVPEVDEQIIKLAKFYKGKVITCDYNLEKKSKLEGVSTFNVYAFSDIFKIAAVPGDILFIKIVHSGKNRKQGVGYLDDGTMIVVEDSGEKIGQMAKVVVTKVLQGDKGKIIFANPQE